MIDNNIFLTAAIILASLDYPDLADYAIKAAIGGLLWMLFKLAAEFIANKNKWNKHD